MACVSDFLFFASNFNKWAGPNNHFLDLCNCLYNEMDLPLTLVTHNVQIEDSFREWIKFPLLPILYGGKPTAFSRLKGTVPNILLLKSLIRDSPSGARIFVNSNIDTLFTAYFVSRRRVKTGYNALLNSSSSTLLKSLDFVAARLVVSSILAHTNYHKYYLEKIGVNANRIVIIPHCVDIDRIEAMSKSFNYSFSKPTIVYAGRLSMEKGITTLLESFPKVLSKVDCRLLVIGDGPLKPWVDSKIRFIEAKFGKDCVESLGWQSADSVLSLMRGADVVVIPSHQEAFGIVILEAMCLRKPVVVANALGGIAEIITPGVDGILVKSEDRVELSNALINVLEDKSLGARIGQNGFQTVSKNYSSQVIADRFLHYIKDSYE